MKNLSWTIFLIGAIALMIYFGSGCSSVEPTEPGSEEFKILFQRPEDLELDLFLAYEDDLEPNSIDISHSRNLELKESIRPGVDGARGNIRVDAYLNCLLNVQYWEISAIKDFDSPYTLNEIIEVEVRSSRNQCRDNQNPETAFVKAMVVGLPGWRFLGTTQEDSLEARAFREAKFNETPRFFITVGDVGFLSFESWGDAETFYARQTVERNL